MQTAATLTIAEFRVPGIPVGKARARVVVNNGRAMAYTPEKTVNFEALVRFYAQQARVPFIEAGPLVLTVEFVRTFPKSMPKKRRATERPTTKPDLSNLLKGVEDALNGVAWRDDSQLVDVRMTKRYGDVPETIVRIERATISA